MKVLKFGGSSLENPQRMKAVAQIVKKNNKAIVVLSAIGNTTNKLNEIIRTSREEGWNATEKKVNLLEDSNKQFAMVLLEEGVYQEIAIDFIEKQSKIIKEILEMDILTIIAQNRILSIGEFISTKLFELYFTQQGESPVFINAFEVMRLNDQADPDLEYIQDSIKKVINKDERKDSKWFIIQGYICVDVNGAYTNLNRGGSDYTATILGALLKSESIEIWTDIDGIHNNDPRIIENTRSVENMTYAEAEELAYFGAKILHPTCVWPAKKEGVPILLKNTMCPDKAGTLITGNAMRRKVTAIAAKDGITSINIHSGRMLNAYGFLRRVFEIFEKYKTPVDMITTSEVSVSLTVDNNLHIKKIENELKLIGNVKTESDQSIVCVVGDFSGNMHGGAKDIFHSLKNVPIKGISYGSSENNVSVLVDTSQKEKALVALHEGLLAN